MKLKQLLAAALLLTGATASLISAPIEVYSPTGGSLTASLYTDGSTFFSYDVRGFSIGLVDGLTTTNIADSTNGTDPSFTTLPFGNLIVNAFTNDLLNIVSLTFDDLSASIGIVGLTMNATGASVANSNGSLNSLVGLVTADFQLLAATPFGAGTIFSYELVNLTVNSSEVPEPNAMLLIGLGLPLIALHLRKRS